jgi:threonine dehydrogenase-like Zn-dependent dehydrogenase
VSAAKGFAVAFVGPAQAELLPVEPNDAPPGPEEIVGRTLVTLVSAGTELFYYARHGGGEPGFVGYAAVFEVTAVGERVETVKPGDIVFAMGGHRSSQRCHVADAVVVPPGLPPEQAVFARLMNVTMSTLTTTTTRPPAKVLVTGLGPVGHLGARVFDLCGYDVVAVDPVEGRRKIARGYGLRDVREAVPLDDPEVAGKVALVLECSGHEQAALDGINAVAKRGEVVLVGVPWEKKTDLTAHAITHAIFHKYAVVRSGWEWEVPRHRTDFVQGSLVEQMAGAVRWIAEGRFRVEGLCGLESPRDCQAVYGKLLAGKYERLAAVFDWRKLA